MIYRAFAPCRMVWHADVLFFTIKKLMVNCWFGLVVWDWNRDTPKQQSLSMRASNQNPNQQAPNQQLSISWNKRGRFNQHLLPTLRSGTLVWLTFRQTKSKQKTDTPSRPKVEAQRPVRSRGQKLDYCRGWIQLEGHFFGGAIGYNWSIYSMLPILHTRIEHNGGHPFAVVVFQGPKESSECPTSELPAPSWRFWSWFWNSEFVEQNTEIWNKQQVLQQVRLWKQVCCPPFIDSKHWFSTVNLLFQGGSWNLEVTFLCEDL